MKNAFPLSKAQYGLYVDCMNNIGKIYYNCSFCYHLDASLDGERMCRAIETAVKAHPALFMRIVLNEDGEPMQRVDVDDQNGWSLTLENTTDIEREIIDFVQPYNLHEERLFRIRLIRDAEHLNFMLDIHHIVSDGTSFQLLLEDIDKAYRGENLIAERLSQGEQALAEAELRKSTAFAQGKEWYAQNFESSDTCTQLIPDLETSGGRKEAVYTRTLNIDLEQTDTFCHENGIYKNNLFTTAYALLMARYNNEQEAFFPTAYNGRGDKRLANTVGMFVRTIPVQIRFDNDTTTMELLLKNQQMMSGCRKHEAYSFVDFMQDIGPSYNTMFGWHGMLFEKDTIGGHPMGVRWLVNSTLGVSLYVRGSIEQGRCHMTAEYNANEYSEAIIAQLLESYEAVVNGLISQKYLRDICITTTGQIGLLDSFNLTDKTYDESQTIVSLFQRQAQETPDNVAVVYKDKAYTYRQVDDLSNRIAAYVAQRGLGREDVVSILIARSEWMVIAPLGVLKAGCAYQPLDPTYPQERLEFMMQDAEVCLLIADEHLCHLASSHTGATLLTKDISLLPHHPVAPEPPTPHDLSILLYTSGSTGTPKGCQLEHSNIVAFCHWYHSYYDLKPTDRVASYASFGFDASMMDTYPTITRGAALHIIPEELRLDLPALNDYFAQNHITHSFMTTQVGYQFATGMELASSLKHLSVGGEKLASLTPPNGVCLHNLYGPTETTVLITAHHIRERKKEIPIGRAIDNTRLYIVDAQGHRLPVGAAGELWIAGPQVSRGYLKRPEKTCEVYLPNPFDDTPKYNRIYRSGDIVRYLPSGEIQFIGRRDGQVKVRGFRIELKEVEAVIREYPGIKDATVQAFDEEGGGKFIVAYIVSDRQVDTGQLHDFILKQKPPYMVPAVSMQIESIPLTPNHKVDRKALPEPKRSNGTATTTEQSAIAMNLLEAELHEMISSIINNTDFGITTPLLYAGLTSITAIKLAVQVSRRYGVALDSQRLIKSASLQDIENEILRKMLATDSDKEEGTTNTQPTLSTQEEEGGRTTTAPLSYAQTGVYLECQKNPLSTVYNIPCMLTYPQGISATSLAEAVKRVIACHPEMSVCFSTQGNETVQTVAESASAIIPVKTMDDEELAAYKKEFVRPFNLNQAPLYRFEVVETPSAVHLLMDVHHLVFDGVSADMFIRQISDALEHRPVNAETYTYLDFVREQIADEKTESFARARKFFAEKLQRCENSSEIPADLPKSDRQGFIGEASCAVDHDRVAQFCRRHQITPAHLFYAATSYVVSRHTNSRDVYICTISSGRSNLKIAETVGMFVNTLALGISIDDISVEEFLQSASQTFRETQENENYPFARIASEYAYKPSIAYAYQVGVLSEYRVNGMEISQEVLELKVPKFKINIQIQSHGVVVEYDDSMYTHALAESLAESIVAVVEGMMGCTSDSRVRGLSIIGPKQKSALESIRTVATGEAPFGLMHDCIAHFAHTKPSATALIACDATYTYAEMEDATNRIATSLRKRGVQTGDRVALLLPRTSHLILSLFGVLKAGATYIPCDPEYPQERVRLILEDSNATYIITDREHCEGLPEEKSILCEELMDIEAEDIESRVCPDDLAYIIYTSGSTGRPKGVMLRHQGICNYLYGHPANVLAHAVLQEAERILSVTTISFDAALQDIGTSLFNSKTLVLATEEEANNPMVLASLIRKHHIDMVSGTPSRWMAWLESEDFRNAISNIGIARAGGEKFPLQLLRQLQSLTRARIFNCYGPTEITVASNNKELTHASMVSVGKPQLNVMEFIVDQDGNELPIGVVGELYIGGRGVARGYNNMEEMTSERFIHYHGERIYRSGDYARWTPDGDVVILGRTDNQIKLRGLRIELNEIENTVLKVQGMEKVVILIRKINGKEHLCAYYTADREITPEALKAEISRHLTHYMVPTAYMQLESMPMTPNGKTDVKALPEPILATSSAYEEPRNETEETFCRIFARILQLYKVGVLDNFFEQGGTSLLVTQLIIEANREGLDITYGDVFRHPTPRMLANLANGDKESAEDAQAKDYDYSAINRVLEGNCMQAFRQGEREALGNVLVTGTTGYLGIHILKELIASDVRQIYCLVRGNSITTAKQRLKTLLFYYFSEDYAHLFDERINIVLGDVTQPIDEDLPVDTIFNCAAVVKHFAEGTLIEDVNIGGAKHCVDFCLKKKARLIHISTASTRGLSVNGIPACNEVFSEQILYMGQFLGNKYIHSKFLAERLILDAVATKGLRAKIMRVGNLSARSTDGEFQINFSTNSFMGRIRVYNMLGCFPHDLRTSPVEFSPIDEVARAIILLSQTPKECCVFHPYNIHTQFMGDVLKALEPITRGIRFVEMEEFENAMEQAKNDPAKAQILASLLAYENMAHGQKTSDVKRSNDYTTQVLFRLGFSWSTTSMDYVERMLKAIAGLGFFDV